MAARPDTRVQRISGGRAQTACLLVFAFAAFGLASPAVAPVAAEPSLVERTSTPVPTSTNVPTPTPTTHSYDDKHSEKRPEGSRPALWILAGAVVGLVAIAVILMRAGNAPRHHVTRRHD